MIRKSNRFILAMCLALCASVAQAGQENLLKSEEGFVALMQGRAIFVAPGVYEVTLDSGERIRVGFGEEARRYDQARLQQELREAKAAPDAAAQSRKIQGLTRALRGLVEEAAGGREAAVTGSTCKYLFTLDGGHTPWMVGGETWGNASIGQNIDFSPPAPPSYYPRRVAYTYVATTAYPGQATPYYASDFDEVLSGLGTASTSAAVNCGYGVWSCASWESFSYVWEADCSDGYRSIHRMG